MDKTESTVRNLLAAIEAPLYDVGVLGDRGMLPGPTAFPPPRYSTGLRCSSTAMPTARISTSGHRESTTSPRLMISMRPRSRGSRRMASLPAPSSKPAPGTSKRGSNTRECFQNCFQPSPRRPLQFATMPTRARRTGGDLDDPRLHQLQTQVSKGGWSLPIRAAQGSQWRAVSVGRSLHAGNHKAL